MLFRRLTWAALTSLVCLTGLGLGSARAAFKPVPLSPEAISAYEKAGGQFGYFRLHGAFGLNFMSTKMGNDDHVPGFVFQAPPAVGFDKLPDLGTDFGIALYGTWIDDTHLNQLKSLDRLTLLTLPQWGRNRGGRGFPGFRGRRGQPVPLPAPQAEPIIPKPVLELKNLTALGLPRAQLTDSDAEKLSQLRNLTHLHIPFSHLSANGLKSLTKLDKLVDINMQLNPVDDSGMKELARMKKLRHASFNAQLVTASGLKQFAALKDLTFLQAHDLRITDQELVTLIDVGLLHSVAQVVPYGEDRPATTQDIQNLTLQGPDITATGLAALSKLKKLGSLVLSDVTLNVESARTLSDLPALRQLILDHSTSMFNDEALAEVGRLDKLTQLTIYSKSITDSGIHHLRNLESLHELHLGRAQLSNASMKDIATLKNLTQLSLSEIPVTNEGLKELRTSKKLVELRLSETEITDDGLDHVVSLPALEMLHLGYCSISNAGLAKVRGSKNLHSLSLHGTDVTSGGLKHLLAMPKLVSVALNPDQISDRWIHILVEANRLDLLGSILKTADGSRPKKPASVTTLDLTNTSATADVLDLFEDWPNLQSIRLSREQITDRALGQLVRMDKLHLLGQATTESSGRPKSLDEITRLNLSRTPVSNRGAKYLYRMKNLVSVNLSSTSVSVTGINALKKAIGPHLAVTHSRGGRGDFGGRPGGFGDPFGGRGRFGGRGDPGGFGGRNPGGRGDRGDRGGRAGRGDRGDRGGFRRGDFDPRREK